jgi:aspartyl-tRNA(Asn)/glutamyl-tRNA(Gln) amidotransferase subunit A
VVGFKPSYGAVSRYGLIAMASSMDVIGAFAANVDDCAETVAIMSGADGRDGTCVLETPFEFSASRDSMSNIRIGLPSEYLSCDCLQPDIKSAVLAAAERFRAAGAVVDEIAALPMNSYALPAAYIISCAEASSNLAKFDGVKYGYRNENARSLEDVYRLSRTEGFGEEVKRRIMFGSLVLSANYYDSYFKKSLQVRHLIRKGWSELYTEQKFDVILSPTAPATAPERGGVRKIINHDDIYCVAANLCGAPAVSLPCGVDSAGLPVGLQLIGNAFEDEKLVSIARVAEKIIGGGEF